MEERRRGEERKDINIALSVGYDSQELVLHLPRITITHALIYAPLHKTCGRACVFSRPWLHERR